MIAPEIESDDTVLAIRATWQKRWLDSGLGNKYKIQVRGSVSLKGNVFTFANVHGQPLLTLNIDDIASVRGHFVMLPGLRGGFIGTGIFESAIHIVPKEKQRDLLYFSWDPGKYATNRGRKYKEWLREFKTLGVPVRNDTYWLSILIVLFFGVIFWLLLRATNVL